MGAAQSKALLFAHQPQTLRRTLLASGGVAAAVLAWSRWRQAQQRAAQQAQQAPLFSPRPGDVLVSSKKKGKKRARVNAAFIRRIWRILKTTCGAREGVTAGLLATTLLMRTVLSVWMANHLGMAVNTFCEQRWAILLRLIGQFAAVTVGGALLNSSLKYYSARLTIEVRQRLTQYVHREYMRDGEMIFYKANKVGPDKIENADHLITDDVDKFCATFSEVFSQCLKPLVDLVVFSVQLGRVQGVMGPVGLYTWFFVATVISTTVMPPYAKLAATKQKLEGRFRARHADLITNCEQVAFLGGERPEKRVLDASYGSLHDHLVRATRTALVSNAVTGYVNKYFASVVGLFLIASPVYRNYNGMGSLTPGDIARYYVSTSRLMTGLSDAVLALFELSGSIGRLAGLTDRVGGLLRGITYREPILEDEIKAHAESNPAMFVEGETLSFKNVSVYRPDGVLLVRNLNFSVRPGEAVIITGSNGCGKSSLFRVLRGLWPLVCGRIVKPPDRDIYFLSQVNFVPDGTLRDLIIYPDTPQEMKERGRTDKDLLQVLAWSDLKDLSFDGVRAELDDTRQWGVDLSPGQKQRVAFARLLYHRPRYAVLDECTNGISPDVESSLYKRCKQLGMAVFSISHKVELKQLHDYELAYLADGKGGYEFKRIDPSQQGQQDFYNTRR